jgi:hypothetical protein
VAWKKGRDLVKYRHAWENRGLAGANAGDETLSFRKEEKEAVPAGKS